MARVQTSYSIIEVDGGPWYRVQLKFVPQVGEFVRLFSSMDAANSKEANHRFEVVAVVHKLGDVSEGHDGHHEVEVWVKRAESPYFS